jgi:hypothetical protein
MDHHLNDDLVEALRKLHGGASAARTADTHEDTRIQTLVDHAFSFLDAIAGPGRRTAAAGPVEMPRLAA